MDISVKPVLQMTEEELNQFRAHMGIVILPETPSMVSKYKKLADTLPVGKSKTFRNRKQALALQRAMNNRGMGTSVKHLKKGFKITRTH